MMINKAPGSLFSANQLNKIESAQEKAISRIASGKQILTAGDDPAGLAMAMALETQYRGLSRGIANRQDEVSLLQVAEGGVSQITDATQRIRELSIQAANGTLTDEDRQAIQAEIFQMNDHINQISNNTEYNTKKLLDGTLKLNLQNGNELNISDMGATALGTATIDVTVMGTSETDQSGASGAQDAIGKADRAINTTTSQRAEFGAISNGITAEARSLTQQMLDTIAANSRIADADIAMQVVELTRTQLLSQAALNTFRIDESMRGQVLKLLE